jgi:hypothetical protein
LKAKNELEQEKGIFGPMGPDYAPHMRLICMLDLLGFKKKIKQLTIGEKVNQYKDLVETIVSASCNYNDYTQGTPSHRLKRVSYQWFSDTFVLYTDEATSDTFWEEEAVDFFYSVKSAFIRFLSRGFPARGAVEFGQVYVDVPENNIFRIPERETGLVDALTLNEKTAPMKGQDENARGMSSLNVIIGNALIEAYVRGEEQVWAGISLSRDTANRFKQINPTRFQTLFADWNVNLKGKRMEKRWVLDWPSDASIKAKGGNTAISEYITDRFNYKEGVDKRSQPILENTLAFAKERTSKARS